MDLSLKKEGSECHLQCISVDYQVLATEGVCLSFPLSAVSLDQNAYTMDLSLKKEGSECHLQCISVDYQVLATDGGHQFFHLQYISVDCQSVATEGGKYVRNHSVQFYRLD